MDEAQAAGVPVAVCSAATKAAVDFVLPNLLGQERFSGLDLYMAGDDVKLKKPDPTIYQARAWGLGMGCGTGRMGQQGPPQACGAWQWGCSTAVPAHHGAGPLHLSRVPPSPQPRVQVAAQRLGVDPAQCLVIEDSMVGLAAALGAGMRCLITYTNSTGVQTFEGADTVVSSLGDVAFKDLAAGALRGVDDRKAVAKA